MTGALLARVGDKAPGARGARLGPAPGVHHPARRSRCAELLRRPRRGGHRHRGRHVPDPGQERRPSRSGSRATRVPCCSRRPATGSTSRRTTTSCSCSTASAASSSAAIDLPGPGQGRSAATGSASGCWCGPPTGDSAWVIDVGRGRMRGAVAAKWGAGPARRRLAQHAAGSARQGRRRARPRRQGHSRDRPGEGRRRRRMAAGRVAPGAGRRGDGRRRIRGAGRRRQRQGRARRCTSR